jgi:hypothetical protein
MLSIGVFPYTDDGLVRQRRVATENYVGRVVAAKKLSCLGSHPSPLRETRVPLLVLNNPLREGLRSVLLFKGMHDGGCTATFLGMSVNHTFPSTQ